MFGGSKRKLPGGPSGSKPGNPFEALAKKKLKSNVSSQQTHRNLLTSTSPSAGNRPVRREVGKAPGGQLTAKGDTKKKKKKQTATNSARGNELVANSAAAAGNREASAIATHVEPLTTARLVDPDQRFIYVGPLRTTEPAPLLNVFKPTSAGPVTICMLHDWSTGSPSFLGVASVEYPTATDLKSALLSVLEARTSSGKIELTRKTNKTPAVLVTVGHSCTAIRSAGVRMFKEHDKLKPNSLGLSAQQLDTHSLEMLGACCTGVAAAALNELASVSGTRSVKMLRQIIRRLQQRAATGRVQHSFLWRGQVTGLPLPEESAKRMRAVLDALDWKAMGNNRNPTGQGKIDVENSFSLGMATYKLSSTGPFSTPFAFRPGLGVWDGASVKKKHKEVWDAAMAMLRSVDPDFHCTSIGFNKNFKGSPHRDDKDCGPQVATALGDYVGGRLRVYTQTGAMDVDTKNRWCRFDGRYEHEVLPFSGTRYSVIYYQLEPSYAVDLTTTEEGHAGAAAR